MAWERRRRGEPRVLGPDLDFPDPEDVGSEWDGMIAVGGDLSVGRLRLAYRSGIFPWSVRPVTWWSPDPRGVMELDGFHVSRSLERTLRRGVFEVTRDRAFDEVVAGCADRRRPGGWITREIAAAYGALHRAGDAHSVECWKDGRLAGGVYGVAVGGVFAAESMFHRESDASKVALFHLVTHLRERGFGLMDIQMTTPITERLGAVAIPRAVYLERLAALRDRDCRF